MAPRMQLGFKYLRISDDREGREVGVNAQDRELDVLGEREHIQWVATYSDNDIGASTRSRKPRPDFDAMMRLVRSGACEGYVIGAYSSSRLTRRPAELEQLIVAAEKHAVAYVYKVSPSLDLNTADGRMLARILAAADAAEPERTGERVTLNGHARALTGEFNGGARAYGIACPCPGPRAAKPRSDGRPSKPHTHTPWEQINAERAIIAELTRRIIEGETIYGLKGELTRRGVQPLRAQSWNARSIKDLLLRPANVGLREYKGAVLRTESGTAVRATYVVDEEGEWSPIVAYEDWEAVRVILADPARGIWHGNTPTSLLAGIARCECGSLVSSGPYETYRARCAHFKRPRAFVDTIIVGVILGMLDKHYVHPASRPIVDHRDEIASKHQMIMQVEDALADAMFDLDLPQAALRRKLGRLRAEVAQLERAQVLPTLPAATAGVSPDTWAGLPLERRREVVRTLVEVRILRGSRGQRLDPSLIEVTPV